MSSVNATPLQFRIILDEKNLDVLEDEPGVPIPFQKRDRIPRTPTSGSPTRRESLITTIDIDESMQHSIPNIQIESLSKEFQKDSLSMQDSLPNIQQSSSMQHMQPKSVVRSRSTNTGLPPENKLKDEDITSEGWCVRKWCILQ